MKYIFGGTAVLIVIGGIIFFPQIKETWEHQQAQTELRDAVEKENAIYNDAIQAVEESSESLTSSQRREVIALILADESSAAAGQELADNYSDLTAADIQAFVDLIIKKQDKQAAKDAYYFSKIINAQQKATLQALYKSN